MSVSTSRLNLLKPEQLDPFVTLDIAENLQKMDDNAAMYVQSAAIDRPAAAKAGRLHFATDTNLLSWDTGTAWLTLGPYVGQDGSITRMVQKTQAEYDALTPVSTTLYVIVG